MVSLLRAWRTLWTAGWLILAAPAVGILAADNPPMPSASPAPAGDSTLADDQRRLADRFRRFEELLLRLAELDGGEDPARAQLLRKAVEQSKSRLVDMQFDRLVELIASNQLSGAIGAQEQLANQLRELLELLLTENQGLESAAEQARLRAALKEVGRLIREQQGLRGLTEREPDNPALAVRQRGLSDRTGRLAGQVRKSDAAEGQAQDDSSKSPGTNPEEDQSEGSEPGATDPNSSEPENPDTEKPDAESTEGESPDGESPEAESPKSESPEAAPPQDSAPSPPENQPPAGPQDTPPPDGQTPEGAPPAPGAESAPPPGGSPMPGAEDDSGQPPPPGEPVAKRLDAAQARMQQAREALEKAEQAGAQAAQDAAIDELEQAQAELERVLRQMREEQREQLLASLEERFRKLLAAERQVYDATVRLSQTSGERKSPGELVEAGRWGRTQNQLVADVDRARLLLAEDGTAVAIPEAVDQLRSDMQQIADRLLAGDTGQLVQAIETDVIAALEELVAAFERAREESQQAGESQEPSGDSGEQPLVDALAELKTIRALQARVNRRTDQIAELAQAAGGAADPGWLKALRELASRQDRIYEITRQLVEGQKP